MQRLGKVRVAAPVPEIGLKILRDAGCEIALGGLDLSDADALLCLLTHRIDAALLARGPRLKVVANMAVGLDNIDLAEAQARGIVVTNTPDVLTDATADLAFALLLATARSLVWGDRFVRSGAFTGWRPDVGVGADVTERTLGVIGSGRIGQAVAERARGFRMNVLERSRRGGIELNELLEQSDFVTLHVPLTQETHHLIGEAELRRMQKHAILVNTSRGAVIDEAALVKALREGWIAGAGLDVFEHEPKLSAGLAALSNVVLAPHVGSATIATRNRMAEIAAQSIVSVLTRN